MKRIVYCLSTMLCLSSCEFDIQPEIPNTENTVYIECIPLAHCDSTAVKVFATEPLNSSMQSRPLEAVSISLTDNGVPVDLYPTASKSVFYSRSHFKPGDKISISANADGYDDASASCIVPQAPEYTVKYLEEPSKYESNYRIQVEVTTTGPEEEYFAVSVKEAEFWESVTWRRGYREYSMEQGDVERFNFAEDKFELIGSKKDVLPGFSETAYKKYNGEYLFVFPAKGKGIINTPLYRKNHEIRAISYHEYGDTLIRGYQYQLNVYKMDALTYSYINPARNDYMIALGLLPPFSSPTNIENGYGCLGALGSRESPIWVDYDPDGISIAGAKSQREQ